MISKRHLTILQVASVRRTAHTGPNYTVPRLTLALHEIGICTAMLVSSRSTINDLSQPYPVFHYRPNFRLAALDSLPQPYAAPDLIVFHSTYLLPHMALASEALRKGIPYVVTPRGGMTRGAQSVKPLKKWMANHLFYNRFVHHAAAIHCLTDNEAAEMSDWHQQVFVVGNGIDLPPSCYLSQPGARHDLRLVFLGRLDIKHKGIDLLLDACTQAGSTLRRVNAQIHLYGPASNCSIKEIKQMITKFGLSDLVHLHGPVAGAAKEKALSEADLFVHTSRFEGHPVAVLEALSHGIPCLLTPGTNMAAEVAAAGAGWQVDGSPKAIAAGLTQAVTAGEQLQQMGAAARQLVATRYSWDHIALQLLEHYELLTSRRRECT